jgi:hypothetical protein
VDPAAPVDERPGHLAPEEARAELFDSVLGRCVLLLGGEEGFACGDEAVHVPRRDGASEAAGFDQVAQRVAARRDHRQPGPEVIEDARAKREARLQVVEMGGHTEVGLSQPGTALGVRDPALVEVDALTLEPLRSGELARLGGEAGLTGLLESGPADAHEHEVSVIEPRGGADRSGGVEPAPDATGPEQDAVLRTDAREARPDRARRLRRGL